jgi:hypothetical protein
MHVSKLHAGAGSVTLRLEDTYMDARMDAQTDGCDVCDCDVCDVCPTCLRVMADGDIVVMDWAGAAVSHVVCARDTQTGRGAQ